MPSFLNVQFRTFDSDGFNQSLFQLGISKFVQWTDTLTSNEGVMFVQWLGYIGASLCFQQNFHARQCFVPTVTEAKNLSKLAKQFNYTIPSNVAALVDLTISTESGDPLQFDVIVPAGSLKAQTVGSDPILFETTEDLFIAGGDNSAPVAAKNQETKTETDTASGDANFRTVLTYGPYIQDSVRVEINGATWLKVDHFLDSNAASTHYRTEADSDGILTVIFGDGIEGQIPSAGATITYTYAVGGGTVGIVPPGSITELIGTFYDVNNNPVDLVVTNANASEGGEDRESLEVSKIRIPLSIAAKEVTIGYEDFVANIQAVGGVARVTPLTVNDNPDIPENTVLAVVLPSTSDSVSGALEAEILDALVKNPTVLTQSVMILSPAFQVIDIDIRDLVVEEQFNDGSGAFSSATIEITNNSFNAGDSVTINGVEFVQGVDWTPGGDVDASALALKNAINASLDSLLQDITASVLTNTVTVSARTMGVHGDEYTLSETDGATDNFTLSATTLENGEDTTIQALIRSAVDAFFGRTNVDAEGEYTVNFGGSVFRNRLIWLTQNINGVFSFNMNLPSGDTALEVNEFPKYTLKFTTS